LNQDIVSAKPHIQIKLKDEAKYLLLNDTALTSLVIKFPDGSKRQYKVDGDTLRFTPATAGTNNTATLDFFPNFIGSQNMQGDDYELIVKGKDRSGNKAGEIEYRVGFKVISKPMISNMMNFPNPFSTSTAFVFTITGSEVPQNLKVQILTVTGKIVREITREELGPLNIGRNITEFKWDGTDQFGQKLANGVYLYRVVSMLNGKKMEKYTGRGDETDRFFNNGYGKMYLMR
jgi:FlgD Ig-like domain